MSQGRQKTAHLGAILEVCSHPRRCTLQPEYWMEAYHHSLQLPQVPHHQYPLVHPYNRHGSGGGAVSIDKLLSNIA